MGRPWRSAVVILALLTILVLGPAQIGRADETFALDPRLGVLYRASYNTFVGALTTDQETDSFATNPFTSTPARWYPATATCYSAGIILGTDAGQSSVCPEAWGATECYDQDGGSGCGSPDAVPDTVDPPYATFLTNVIGFGGGDVSLPGDPYFGIGNCPTYTASCADNNDADASFNVARSLLRNFIGVFIDKGTGEYYRFRAEILNDAGTSAVSAFTPFVCAFSTDTCTLRGEYVSSILTLTITTSSNVTQVSVTAPTGEIRLNAILAEYADVAGAQARFRLDETKLTYRVSGSYQSFLRNLDSRILSTYLAFSAVTSARSVCSCVWFHDSANTASRTAITSGSDIRIGENDLSTGSYGPIRRLEFNATLTAERVASPALQQIQITTEGNVPVIPPEPIEGDILLSCVYRWPQHKIACVADERFQSDLTLKRSWFVDGQLRQAISLDKENGTRFTFEPSFFFLLPWKETSSVTYRADLINGGALTGSTKAVADTFWLLILYLLLATLAAIGKVEKSRAPRKKEEKLSP